MGRVELHWIAAWNSNVRKYSRHEPTAQGLWSPKGQRTGARKVAVLAFPRGVGETEAGSGHETSWERGALPTDQRAWRVVEARVATEAFAQRELVQWNGTAVCESAAE